MVGTASDRFTIKVPADESSWVATRLRAELIKRELATATELPVDEAGEAAMAAKAEAVGKADTDRAAQLDAYLKLTPTLRRRLLQGSRQRSLSNKQQATRSLLRASASLLRNGLRWRKSGLRWQRSRRPRPPRPVWPRRFRRLRRSKRNWRHSWCACRRPSVLSMCACLNVLPHVEDRCRQRDWAWPRAWHTRSDMQEESAQRARASVCALGDAAALMHARHGTLGVYRCGIPFEYLSIPFWRVCAQILVMGRLLTGEWGRRHDCRRCAHTHTERTFGIPRCSFVRMCMRCSECVCAAPTAIWFSIQIGA